VLHEIASRENMTTTQFAVKLYDELITLRGEVPSNYASFLRVCCLRYMSIMAGKSELTVDALPPIVVPAVEPKPRVLKTV
jgi:predicted DNA-binding ribbon-helix-helix protein